MASWDDENFDPSPAAPTLIPNTDKWEGEDEDDDVKENWEDEEEEKSKQDDVPLEIIALKPKKTTLNEKERKKREELEQRLKDDEAELTPEEKLKQEKASDLSLFMETTCTNTNFGDDLTSPTTKEEFEEFGTNLAKKIQTLSKSIDYPAFAEGLIRDICVTCECKNDLGGWGKMVSVLVTSHDIKKIKITVDNMYLEKQKMEKGEKTKKNKGKGKVKLKMDDNNQLSAYDDIDTYNEYDDFM